MFIVMQEDATDEQIQAVITRLVTLDLTVHRSTGAIHTVLGVVGSEAQVDPLEFAAMEGVKDARRVTSPYKLASRSFRPEGTVIRIRDLEIGSGQPVFIARSRTSRSDILLIGEVTGSAGIPKLLDSVDILQVGSSNMQNRSLLSELGGLRKPVLLQRGTAATIEDLLVSAEHVISEGNNEVILCESGIRTFETYTRYTLDISAIPIARKLSHLPIVADPLQATGRSDLVLPMARAAIAAGADGVILDGNPDQLAQLLDQIGREH